MPHHPKHHYDLSKPSKAPGCLSARQWSDIRQAARLVKSDGVRMTVHGVLLAPDSTSSAGKPQKGTREPKQNPAPDESKDCSSMDTVDDSPALSKKQQRDAQRLADYREKQRVAPVFARWALLVCRCRRRVARTRLDAVWTAHMRREPTEETRKARSKLRALLRPYVWQQWTKPYFTPDRLPGARTHAYGLEMLGQMSKRDEYLLRRTRAFALASGLQRCFVHHGMNGATKTLWSWLRQPRLNTRGEATSADNGSGSAAGTRRAALQSLPEAGEKHTSTPPPRQGGRKKTQGGRRS